MALDDAEPGEPDGSSEPRAGRRVSRRAVVVGIGGAATAAAVAVLVGTQLDDDGDGGAPRDASGDAGADVPSDREAVRRVGDAYRAAYPEEDDVEVLRAALPDFDGLSGAEVQAQLSTLREQVRADFAEGNVVMVDGWLLAATEARAAALVSLLG